jgi:hypothetical protein
MKANDLLGTDDLEIISLLLEDEIKESNKYANNSILHEVRLRLDDAKHSKLGDYDKHCKFIIKRLEDLLHIKGQQNVPIKGMQKMLNMRTKAVQHISALAKG